jgi:hypothetical protein
MASKSQRSHKRPVEIVMQADFVRLTDEAPLRYPLSRSAIFALRSEGRIRTYGSPAMIKCSEFEAQMEKGFPVITEIQTHEHSRNT